MKYTLNQKIIDNIVLLFLVLSTGGLLFVFNRNLASIIFFIFLVGVIIFSSKGFKRNLVNSTIITCIFFFLLGLLNYYFAIVEQTSNKYFFNFLTVLLCVFTLFHFRNNRNSQIIIERMHFILYLIALHAAINFIMFFYVSDDLILITSTYHECETFMHLFFYTTEKAMVTLFGFEFCRNQGLFWEPGILQAYLNILFFLEAFIIRKNKKTLFFTALLILTTYSTTGLAILLIQMAAYLKQEIKKTKFVIPAILILAASSIIFSINVDSKIKGERQSSFQKRIFDLTQPISIALEYPLTGIGLDMFQFQKIRQEFYISSKSLESINSIFGVEKKVEVTDKGSSNSIMFLLAATGFPTTILLLIMLFNQRLITHKRWLWMIVLLISIMSEPLLLRPFFFIFIISGFFDLFRRIKSHKRNLA